ncbi:unnamed protein product [Prorocentrum cordatum]|uniref:Peptidase M16 middle/third domain-containing protein n=1 Tax=Prorocentrum cordatum TaxID=2364126 RepID=A0ABN9U017_9DINO|nr:unnamed protein product [Polarella glacialis]
MYWRPDVLVLDDPSEGLSPAARERLAQLLMPGAPHSAWCAMIVASRDRDLMDRVCNVVIDATDGNYTKGYLSQGDFLRFHSFTLWQPGGSGLRATQAACAFGSLAAQAVLPTWAAASGEQAQTIACTCLRSARAFVLFCSPPSPLRVLDAGTGTGLLSLVLAQQWDRAGRDPSAFQAWGVDVDEPAATVAAANFAASPWAESLRAVHASFGEWVQNACAGGGPLPDICICNPPYGNVVLNEKPGCSAEEVLSRRRALERSFMPLDEVCQSALRMGCRELWVLWGNAEDAEVRGAAARSGWVPALLVRFQRSPRRPKPLRERLAACAPGRRFRRAAAAGRGSGRGRSSSPLPAQVGVFPEAVEERTMLWYDEGGAPSQEWRSVVESLYYWRMENYRGEVSVELSSDGHAVTANTVEGTLGCAMRFIGTVGPFSVSKIGRRPGSRDHWAKVFDARPADSALRETGLLRLANMFDIDLEMQKPAVEHDGGFAVMLDFKMACTSPDTPPPEWSRPKQTAASKLPPGPRWWATVEAQRAMPHLGFQGRTSKPHRSQPTAGLENRTRRESSCCGACFAVVLLICNKGACGHSAEWFGTQALRALDHAGFRRTAARDTAPQTEQPRCALDGADGIARRLQDWLDHCQADRGELPSQHEGGMSNFTEPEAAAEDARSLEGRGPHAPRVATDLPSGERCQVPAQLEVLEAELRACCRDTSYESPMKLEAIPADHLSLWSEAIGPASRTAEEAVDAAAALGLKLPDPNPFIAEDLSVKPLPEGGVPKKPVLLPTDGLAPVARIYHRQDDVFRQPKASISFVIYTPFPMSEGIGMQELLAQLPLRRALVQDRCRGVDGVRLRRVRCGRQLLPVLWRRIHHADFGWLQR